MWRMEFTRLWFLMLVTALSSQSKANIQNWNASLSQNRHHDVERITISSDSRLCRSGKVPNKDSYSIIATGNERIYCLLSFTDMENSIVRLGSQLAPGETFQLVGGGYHISISSQSPPYGCYFLMGDNFELSYTKQDGVEPKINVMVTSAECAEQGEKCDVACRLDGCVAPNSIGCSIACIDDDFFCDKYQQCPYGEDESCGQITTVTPTDQTAQPPSTTLFPSHIQTVFTGAGMAGCGGAVQTFTNLETIITNMNDPSWTGQCRFKFLSPNRGADDDDMTVLRFEGQLGGSESILISGGTGKLTLTHKTKVGECFITTGTFFLTYQSRGPATEVWRLISTPIDCDEDDYCPARCSTSACHSGRSSPCKRSGCIKGINICDGIQQCPNGEDESCGQIVTVIPPHHGLSGGYILLIVLAVVCLMAALVGGVLFLRKSRRHHKDPTSGMSIMDAFPHRSPNYAPEEPQHGGKKDVKDDENIYEVA